MCMGATVLDPRYKSLCFLNEDQYKTTYNEVKSCMDFITMSGSKPETLNTQEPKVHIKKEHGTWANVKLEKHSSV